VKTISGSLRLIVCVIFGISLFSSEVEVDSIKSGE